MRIVIVEDDAVVSSTLSLYLARAGYETVVARDGVRGLELASSKGVALLILDLMVPGIPGHEICKRLRKISTLPIMMLTARTSEADQIEGFDLGADDYVPKPFRPREVVARVQALLRRTSLQSAEPPPPIVVGGLEIDCWSRSVRVHGEPVALTRTEFRLLEVFSKSLGRTFTREELLTRAFDPDFDGVDRTVDVHITNLRRKIDRHGEHYILTVHGVGYRMVAR
jgi:DNA-binding response OmpR family regulator